MIPTKNYSYYYKYSRFFIGTRLTGLSVICGEEDEDEEWVLHWTAEEDTEEEMEEEEQRNEDRVEEGEAVEEEV